jgi:tRNA (cmo5U34)-methyltransferase
VEDLMETQARPRENWADESFVASWLEREHSRAEERRLQFTLVRSLVPRAPDEPFRYMNLGAGDGSLDEFLLERFSQARATLVDGSSTMVEGARQRLGRFGDRVTVVRADLAGQGWQETVSAPFDLAVSTIALHNLRDPRRIRELYAETYEVMADGGFFMNFDYLRPSSPALGPLAPWASADSEAQFFARSHSGGGGGRNNPGTIEEQLVWLREAGFAPVDCFWKEFIAALFGGFKGAVRIPQPA